MSSPVEVFAGIDVAKSHLELALRPGGAPEQFANTEQGISALVARLQAVAPALVVLEATGGLEAALVAALGVAQVPVVVVNPRQVRDFAKASGKLAKTDRLDAQVLAHFGQALRPQPRPLPAAEQQRLAALLARRRQVIEMLTAERNRLATAVPAVRERIAGHIAWLEEELQTLDGTIAQAIQQSPLWRTKEEDPAQCQGHRPGGGPYPAH
jgi:transposase